MDKNKLDEIIQKHKGQPVGNGYSDIIVARDTYKDFVSDLVNNGYKVKNISWWEWCPERNKNNYGMGGPVSNYYNGWFSEFPIDLDELRFSDDLEYDQSMIEIIEIIEAKTISYPYEILTFKHNKCLTPAFGLDVPDEWNN